MHAGDNAIQRGAQDALFDGKFGGDPLDGMWNGFLNGLKTLGKTIKHAFENFPKNLLPWYGNYCSPAATGSNTEGTGINAMDDSVCRAHDKEYQRSDQLPGQVKNDIRFRADKIFVFDAIFRLTAAGVSGFDIAFSGQFGGRPLIGSVYKFFAVPIFGTSAIIRKVRGAK